MRFAVKNINYLLILSTIYFSGCAKKSEISKPTNIVAVSQVSKDLEETISEAEIKQTIDEETPVFKKEISSDSSFLTISGYCDGKKEEVILTYNLINHKANIYLRRDNGNRVNISFSASRPDIITWGVEVNNCSLETVRGERISFSGSQNIDSPAKGNLNFTDADFWKVKYYAREKSLFYLNRFEKDIDNALKEANKRYMDAERDFKRIEDFFE